MNLDPSPPDVGPARTSRRTWNIRIALVTSVSLIICAVAVVWVIKEGVVPKEPSLASISKTKPTYPIGTKDSVEPSGVAPPGAHALRNYYLRYETDFTGDTLPSGWSVFTGVPGGDPGAQFGSRHVVIAGGLLRLNTWKDSQYGGEWVTGGLCQCALGGTYGAYFVRSRLTGVGPNEVELLWPYNNQWPPEIDFNETGHSDITTSSTIHYGVRNGIEQHGIHINMLQWHTWGVVWSPTEVLYVVDGHVWASITSPREIPKIPMTLDFEQRTGCTTDRDCPTGPVSMLIDWVAEYRPEK